MRRQRARKKIELQMGILTPTGVQKVMGSIPTGARRTSFRNNNQY